MISWPDVAIPPLEPNYQLPDLRVKASSGLETISGSDIFTLYVCGITPYDATHLGHAATYLTYDLIQRYLLAQGRKVIFAENVTDIDDPLFERAKRDNCDWQELATSQIDLFRSDMSSLHILPPKSFIAVTEVIPLIISCVETLMRKGFAYKVDQDIYFDIKNFKSRLPITEAEARVIFAERGGDPERPGKRDPLDPLLWLAHREGEPEWAASFGSGRPGWHIECSAIALRYLLGPDFERSTERTISLQGGGSDLIFPHHFMSGAQAEALTGSPFARTYLHAGMMGLDGEKMSKSKGNLIFVSSLLRDGVDPMVIRHALMSDHYSKDRMWTDEHLHRSKRSIDRIRLALAKQEVSGVDTLMSSIGVALSKDLDTPTALELLDKWADLEISNQSVGTTPPGAISRYLDAILGLAL